MRFNTGLRRFFYRSHKPPHLFVPCRLDFDTPLSSIATLPQSMLRSRPHSWLPSTNPPYFTLASLHFLSFPSFYPLTFRSFPPVFFPLSLHSYNTPTQLLYRPVLYCSPNSEIGSSPPKRCGGNCRPGGK